MRNIWFPYPCATGGSGSWLTLDCCSKITWKEWLDEYSLRLSSSRPCLRLILPGKCITSIFIHSSFSFLFSFFFSPSFPFSFFLFLAIPASPHIFCAHLYIYSRSNICILGSWNGFCAFVNYMKHFRLMFFYLHNSLLTFPSLFSTFTLSLYLYIFLWCIFIHIWFLFYIYVTIDCFYLILI